MQESSHLLDRSAVVLLTMKGVKLENFSFGYLKKQMQFKVEDFGGERNRINSARLEISIRKVEGTRMHVIA